MIIFENGISEIVNQMPVINGFYPAFHWGDEFELVKYISLKKEKDYPLVWLENSSEEHSMKEVDRNCRFILAVNDWDHQEELNDVRIEKSYIDFLNPLAENLIFGLSHYKRTRIVDDKFTIRKFPNYSDNGKHKTIDRWDALTIDCRIIMNNNCKNTIIWPQKT